MIIHRKSTFFLGIFIFLIPFLGLPSSWKTTLIILSGLGLVSLSTKIILPKNRRHKARTMPVHSSLETTKLEVKEETASQSDTELK